MAREGSALTLRMGRGEVADLEHWHHDTFRVLWRDELDQSPAPAGLRMRLNRDWIEARRRP